MRFPLPRRIRARGLRIRPSSEGMARQEAQANMVRALMRERVGASRRATCAQAAKRQRMLICGNLSAAGPRFHPRCRFPSLDRRPAVGIGSRVVSQLLAGTLGDPGRSPGAARVPGCEPGPQDAAPPVRLTTPHESTPQWTRWMQDRGCAKRGISFNFMFAPSRTVLANLRGKLDRQAAPQARS